MAQMNGFTVVDCSSVVAPHLSHLMQVYAGRLLGRVESQALVEHVMGNVHVGTPEISGYKYNRLWADA